MHSDSLIECHIKHIVRKILQLYFRMQPQPNGALQNYSILRPGYRSVRFLDTKCTVDTIRTYCHSICADKNWSTQNFTLQENAPSWHCIEWNDKRTYVSLIHIAILTTIYWISLLKPSPVMWQLWSCYHAYMVECQQLTNLLLNVWNCK